MHARVVLLGMGKGVLFRERCPQFRGVLIEEFHWHCFSPLQVHESDLALTNEGQRLINYMEVINNYFSVLGSLEGSICLPHQPIEIGVAADTHR